MSFLFESPVKTPEELPSLKYYPIFDKRWSTSMKFKTSNNDSNQSNRKKISNSTKSNRSKPYSRKKLFDSSNQYVLDFGQKNFDAQRCKICNMLYTVGEIVDEKTHEEYHDKFVNSLKYRDWKNETVVKSFHDGRIVQVLPTSPHYMHRKLDELFEIADIELGINMDLQSSMKSTSMFLIFISLPSKRITGFLSAERIRSANKILSENPLMASMDESPALCGISRIWVHHNFRRQKIATRLVDTLRLIFFPNKSIAKNLLAFSDPTTIGKEFAKCYLQSETFLIYMHHHIVEQDGDEGNSNRSEIKPIFKLKDI
ncbi:N-acetyltransferase ESCO2 [Sarcoptes scabiei]|uniref:N-acetyltransferase ESCO2 n=1 Tax=Sarcoptes scabiei TaxID=52283 RepID=A0A834VC05_SARSC|nr:N-acetyltransferase ESCO2 [Sarcoptes scabiei]UXI17156.1 WD repeat-containing protein 74 [Sarcoptes scabiei]